MLYWDRLGIEEDVEKKWIFNELEKVSIFHNTQTSLADSLEEYLTDPGLWTNNKKRKSVIDKILKEIALVDSNWHIPWKNYVLSVAKL